MLKKIYKYLLKMLFFLIYGKISLQQINKQKNIKIIKISKLKSQKSQNKSYFLYEIKNGRVYTDNTENVAIINGNQIIKNISFQQKNSFIKPAKYNSTIKQGTPAIQKKLRVKF